MKQSGLSNDDVNRIQTVFSKYKNVKQVLIYGSRAMGNFKPASDIDLTLIGENIDLSLLQQIIFDLDDLLLPYKFDVSIYEHITNPEFLHHINRVGKVLYCREKK